MNPYEDITLKSVKRMGATKTMDFLTQSMGDVQSKIVQYKYGKIEHDVLVDSVANLLLAAYHTTLMLGKVDIDENINSKMRKLDIKYGGDGNFTSTSTQQFYEDEAERRYYGN